VSRFASTLNYSSVNEDWRTEARALDLGPGDRVLAITGGGRPLDLLLPGPERVVAIDAVPAQSALLALEVAAMRALSYEAYASFLGLTPTTRAERGRVLDELLARLDAESGAFWVAHRSTVERGVLLAGRWERFFRLGSLVGRLVRPAKIRRLFAFEDLDAQRAFVLERWDTPAWRWLHDAFLSRFVLRHVLGDPAFHAHVAVPPGRFVRERMQASLLSVLARENFMVSLTLRGRLADRDLPPRLTPEGVAAIRGRLDRLEIVTGDVIAHLEEVAPGTYTRFSLSDVPSYLSQEDFERLLDGVARAGAPGARFCIRLFLSRPRFPERHATVLVREPGLEARLAEEDHAFAYDFIVGSLAR
jgi:S-adenosylmethionine-diacylglycerol 3-amino-3-carboxypropyl transferase